MVPSISTFVVSLFSFSFVKSYDLCAAAAHARGRMCVRASGCNHASPMDRYGIQHASFTFFASLAALREMMKIERLLLKR